MVRFEQTAKSFNAFDFCSVIDIMLGLYDSTYHYKTCNDVRPVDFYLYILNELMQS